MPFAPEVHPQRGSSSGQTELIVENVAGAAGESPQTGPIACPCCKDLPGPVEPSGLELFTILVAQMAALVIQLNRQCPRAEECSGVDARHPIVTDQSSLTVTETES